MTHIGHFISIRIAKIGYKLPQDGKMGDPNQIFNFYTSKPDSDIKNGKNSKNDAYWSLYLR